MNIGRPHVWRIALPTLLILLFLANGLNDALQHSAVADEVGGHTSAGYLYWTTGKYSGGIANFPLPHLLIALPVILFHRTYELFTEQHLLLFRLPVLLMGTLLAILVYRLAAGLFDRRTALASLFLFSLSPNLLAHASLATLDVPLTFFVFLTVYTLWRAVRQPHWARMLALSFALGCALVTKIPAFLLVPTVLIVLPVLRHTRRDRNAHTPLPRWAWLFLPLVPWLVINTVYLNFPFSSGHLLPPQYLDAVTIKLTHASAQLATGHAAYLCGRYSESGWWYYFPFAILVKTPGPMLVLLALGLVRRHTLESLLIVLLPIAAFLGVAMAARLNIGIRHILVIYPFLFLLAGNGAARLWTRGWRGGVLVVLAAWYVWQAAVIPPHHLSYFNTLSGGTRNGHRLLIDSNYDWGQNDGYLRRYIREQGIPCRINPDPFRPTTGRIFVNANALHGTYGAGGEMGYRWLKRFQPVNQIAYTWFEYDVPEDALPENPTDPRRVTGPTAKTVFRPWNYDTDPSELDAALEHVELYLRGLSERYRDIREPQFRMPLGLAYAATASYGTVLDEMRALVEQYPECELALGLGGEVMVRWKVGSLKFENTEYLTGFREARLSQDGTRPDTESAARAAALAGITAAIAIAHSELGAALEGRGRIREAAHNYRAALEIEPTYEPARIRFAAIQAALGGR